MRSALARLAGLRGEGQRLHFHATDGDLGQSSGWTVRHTPDRLEWEHGHGKGDVAVRGPAADLHLVLQRRIPPARVQVLGDAALLGHWVEHTRSDEVHNRIPVLRADRGISRRDLATALGVHYQTVGYLERGEYKPSLHLALRIAAYFQVPVEIVFSLERSRASAPRGVSRELHTTRQARAGSACATTPRYSRR